MQPDGFFEAVQATAEEKRRFLAFDALFCEVAAHTNLVARASLEHRWERHYYDSAQLFGMLPQAAESVLDIGAGGGFPSVVLAILAAERRPALTIHACDRVGKKARFVAEAAREVGLRNLRAHHEAAEALARLGPFDVVTARAVTALDKLLDLAVPLLKRGGVLLFPKGRRAQEELDAARERWSFQLVTETSATDPDARVLILTQPSPMHRKAR